MLRLEFSIADIFSKSGGEPIPGKSRKKGGGVWGTQRGQNQLQRRFWAHIGAPQPGSEPGAPQSKKEIRISSSQNWAKLSPKL